MEETQRYINSKEHISKYVEIKAIFQKYGINHGNTERTTCLTNLKVNDIEIIDHTWCISKELINAKLRTGQPIIIKAKISERIRPTQKIGISELDVKISKIQFINKTKARRKKK